MLIEGIDWFLNSYLEQLFIGAIDSFWNSLYIYLEYLIHGFLSNETLDDWLNERFNSEWKKGSADPSAGNLAITPIHVDVNIVDGVELDIEAFKKSKPAYANAEFILEDGK